ncbi:right-handed parallel beta-helix repeat-containing protein, partial [candidate division KSB1 bacterium]
RRVGEKEWQQAMPLRRVPADTSIGTTPIFRWDNKHSGSIFNLRPDTEYEINLKLSDPDGGAAEKTVRARTRAVPRPMRDAPIKEANPRNFKEVAAAAVPGDIIQLTTGYYFDWEATRDGLPGKPIVIRAYDRSVFDSISLRDRKHVYLDGLTLYGSIDLLGGENLTVRRCQVEARFGIIAKRPPGAKNCYIADNTVTYVMPWESRGMGSGMATGGPACIGEGIEITGPGNVICYNYVKGYRDCISTMEDRNTGEQVCIDIYNNDVYLGADDGIESDFCMHNCRIMYNRITNSYMGVSSQPGLGGPTYFIRNAMYNIVHSPFKLHRHSKGDVALHNTAIKVGDGLCCRSSEGWSHALFRNNLMIGGIGGGFWGRYNAGDGLAIYLPGADETCDLDYDAVGTYHTAFEGLLGDVKFSSIEELREKTSEKHAIRVDMTIFNGVAFPHPPVPEREPADLRPLINTAVIDAGARLPNINDDYKGDAPDIGCYEEGQKLPHYGPRAEGLDEMTPWLHK